MPTNTRLFFSLIILAILGLSFGTPPSSAAEDRTTTWANSHPEVLELFGLPFAPAGMQHRRKFPAWPAEEFPAKLAASQPTLALTKDQVLIAQQIGWLPAHPGSLREAEQIAARPSAQNLIG